MIKAGADIGATGEIAIIQTVGKIRYYSVPIAIIAANSMMGELTPDMAAAVSSCKALKVLIPLNRCNLMIALHHQIIRRKTILITVVCISLRII